MVFVHVWMMVILGFPLCMDEGKLQISTGFYTSIILYYNYPIRVGNLHENCLKQIQPLIEIVNYRVSYLQKDIL